MSFFGGGSSSSSSMTPPPSSPNDIKRLIIESIQKEMAVSSAQTLVDVHLHLGIF
jgi:hypothetical protein